MDFSLISKIENNHFIFIIATSGLFITIGIFGNVISIIIFNSKDLKKESNSVYIIASCFMNIATIIYLPVMYLSTIWIISDINCVMFLGTFGLLVKIQGWIVAIGSFDRLITTLKPHSFLWKNKLKFQILAILSIFLMILLIGFPDVYFLKAVASSSNFSMCSYPTSIDSMWILFYYKIEYLLIRVSFPFLTMLISSVIITWKMCKIKIRRATSPNLNLKKERRLFASLIALDIFFIVFRIPMLFYIFTCNESETFLTSFVYAFFMSIGLLSNVFYFSVLLFSNKIYRRLFGEIMTTKYFRTRKPNNLIYIKNNLRKNNRL